MVLLHLLFPEHSQTRRIPPAVVTARITTDPGLLQTSHPPAMRVEVRHPRTTVHTIIGIHLLQDITTCTGTGLIHRPTREAATIPWGHLLTHIVLFLLLDLGRPSRRTLNLESRMKN